MRLTRVFLDSDLRCSFEGLRLIAKQANTELKGSTVMFINSKTTMFKLLEDDKYLISYSNGSKRIPLEAIRHLPQAFGGTEMEMKQAIEKTIKEKLRIKE